MSLLWTTIFVMPSLQLYHCSVSHSDVHPAMAHSILTEACGHAHRCSNMPELLPEKPELPPGAAAGTVAGRRGAPGASLGWWWRRCEFGVNKLFTPVAGEVMVGQTRLF